MQCYKNIDELITLKAAAAKDGRNLVPEDLSIIKNGAIVFDQNKILWVGSSKSIPKNFQDLKAQDFTGHIIMPGLVDSHTHLVFAGDRSFEYAMRLNGATYEDIYQAGGGILKTMKKTQKASDDELFELAVKRINHCYSKGVRALEIKSGYGLTHQHEKRITLIIDRLKKEFKNKIRIFNTFMAAHAIPGEYKKSSDYMDRVVIPLLEELAPLKIIDAVDIFHEKNYFSKKDCELLFNKAQELGINRKIHADELNDNSGASLAVKYECLSADHLLQVNDSGLKKLAKSKTVATMLPGTALFLGKPLPPARKFLDAGAKVALASDYNPGSCHMNNLFMLAQMTAKNLAMNTAELMASITLNAAHSLGYHDIGSIEEEKAPVFSIARISSLDKLLYSWDQSFFIN